MIIDLIGSNLVHLLPELRNNLILFFSYGSTINFNIISVQAIKYEYTVFIWFLNKV